MSGSSECGTKITIQKECRASTAMRGLLDAQDDQCAFLRFLAIAAAAAIITEYSC